MIAAAKYFKNRNLICEKNSIFLKYFFLTYLFLNPVLNSAQAELRKMILHPYNLINQKGYTSDQGLAALQVRDQREIDNEWSKYLVFYPAPGAIYRGRFDFLIPNHIPKNSIKSLSIQFNYMGPSYEFQQWMFQGFLKGSSSWKDMIDNRAAQNWLWSFDQKTFSRDEIWGLIDDNRMIRIRLSSSNSFQAVDLDYFVLELEYEQ